MRLFIVILHNFAIRFLCNRQKLQKRQKFLCDVLQIPSFIYRGTLRILNEEGIFMDLLLHSTSEKADFKAGLIEFLEQNDISYDLIECRERDELCPDKGIIVQTRNKDVFRIYPHEILYIAIEGRKSVVYLTDRKLETNCRLDYWKDILDPGTFSQPHHSYIVNLTYVDEVVRDLVTVKCGDKEYRVYTSSRKINTFKKDFLDFGKR